MGGRNVAGWRPLGERLAPTLVKARPGLRPSGVLGWIMNIGKEELKVFLEKSVVIVNLIIPGTICLDLFLNKGLFSNTTFTIFSFILYIFWAIAISLFLGTGIPSRLLMSNDIMIDEIEKMYKQKPSLVDNYEEKMDESLELLKLIYISIRIVIIYVIILLLKNISASKEINDIYIKISAFLFSYIVSYPFGIFISYINRKMGNRIYRKYYS